jgi:ribosome-associated protein
MNSSHLARSRVSADVTAIESAKVAAKAAADKLAENIVAVDVSERLAITDLFLIASASTERQVNSIVDNIEDELIKVDRRPVRREGRSEGRWVLLDYGDMVIHVMHDEDRSFYALERLWKDCPVVDLGLEEPGESAASAAG